jgi:hypothetical protein
MNLNRSYKIVLAALLAAQNFVAVGQNTNALGTADFPKFIAARNIFDPDREPNVPYAPRPRTTYTAPVVRQVDSFSLVGIIGYGEGRLAGVHAFFNGSSLQYQKAAQLNDSIAGFKVAGIAADSVTLVSGTNRMVLEIGEQLHNDGIGHWLFANGTTVRYNSASGYGRNSGRGGFGGRRRNNNYGNYNNDTFNNGNNGNGNFNRGRSNFVPSLATSDNSQAQDSNAMDPGDVALPVLTPDGIVTPDGTLIPIPDNTMPSDNSDAPGDTTPPDNNQ